MSRGGEGAGRMDWLAGDGSGARTVLLTGATGFLGKVVLEELARRRHQLRVERVFALIRPQGSRAARERFDRDVAGAECFSGLEPGWTDLVEVLEGDLAQAGCGLTGPLRDELLRSVTHVIHCAASVDFDLPLEQATQDNVTSTLQVLDLARGCQRLERMVSVSTAYVTAHPGDGVPVEERLAPLPGDAETLYESILAGEVEQTSLLAASGHPNTYTLTKCLAEHLLMQRRGDVPLSILRPSIISASWRTPFPGWIDSAAAFAGFVSLIGAGCLRAVAGALDSRVDLVPVDWVARSALDASFEGAPRDRVPIRHVTAGVARSPSIRDCREEILGFFRGHAVMRPPAVRYVGPPGVRFRWMDRLHNRLPVHVSGLLSPRTRKSGKRLLARLDQLNGIFPYFTQRTFDFRSSALLEDASFAPRAYVATVCRGVYRHLMRGDETQLPIAGRRHPGYGGDLRWVLRQPVGGALHRLAAWLVAKVLRRCAGVVSVDIPSFEAARRATPAGSCLVLAPSHRSYMDFVICSYLCFARPELGIEIPHVAAALEFSRIPVLGRLLRGLGAFYLERGRGREEKNLTRQVHSLVREGRTVEFFIEGGRSRSRRFLAPKRGLLRSLQATGNSCTLVPVSFSYDRVPEERSFALELAGGEKPKMRLVTLLGWTFRMLRGEIDLGRVHVACGTPLELDLASDARAVSRMVVAEHQATTAVTQFHLRAFLSRIAVDGVDVEWLREALVRRGARVLDSPLVDGRGLDPRLADCLRYQFEHWFYPEARVALAGHPAVQHHLALNDFARPHAAGVARELDDERLQRLLRALFEPICLDYARVAEALGAPEAPLRVRSARELVRRDPKAHLPSVEAAFADLVSRGILVPGDRPGEHAWGPRAGDLVHWETLYRGQICPEQDAAVDG